MTGAALFLGAVCYVLVLAINEHTSRIKQLEQKIRNLEAKQ